MYVYVVVYICDYLVVVYSSRSGDEAFLVKMYVYVIVYICDYLVVVYSSRAGDEAFLVKMYSTHILPMQWIAVKGPIKLQCYLD